MEDTRFADVGSVTIKGKGWQATVPPQVARDYIDGAALRRLREALPKSWASGGYVLIEDGNGDVLVGVGHYTSRDEPDERDPIAHAATIAEAADKCCAMLLAQAKDSL